ncbi:DUF3139 domain-containing protein, partial [Clostridioides difficile]|uniref:DUF3139 domain-containing protein n=1 Tax=Clostridioides difficile TaxID=1496 RepID=UPI001F27E4A6
MKKYKVIFIVLIIGIISVTGFVVYKNYVKPWKDAETYIDKYMVKQDISKDNIKSITKEKAKKASYEGILYKVYYLSLIIISEPTISLYNAYDVFCFNNQRQFIHKDNSY